MKVYAKPENTSDSYREGGFPRAVGIGSESAFEQIIGKVQIKWKGVSGGKMLAPLNSMGNVTSVNNPRVKTVGLWKHKLWLTTLSVKDATLPKNI